MGQNDTPRTIGAVDKACRIIDLLESYGGISVTELANELDISRSTTYFYLATLVENGYAVKRNGKYYLSLRYLSLNQAVKQRIGVYDLVAKELEQIAEESGERAQFYMEENGKVVYVARSSTNKAIKSSIDVGGEEYMHCVSGGKVILAHYSQERIEQIIEEHGLKRYTENTITDRDEFLDHLNEIEEQGHAIHDEERVYGVRCIAAPVFLYESDVVSSISVCGAKSRMPDEYLTNEVLDRIRKAANLIEVNSTLPYGDS